MLVLHASIDRDGDLLAWATRADDGHGPAPADELTAALEQLVSFAPLPIERRTMALPAETGTQLEPTEVDCIRCTPTSAVELLDACAADTRLAVPGLAPGAELTPLRMLARAAGTAVVRQELVPSLHWDVRDDDAGEDDALVATWDPMPGPQLRQVLDACARSLNGAARALEPDRSASQLATRFHARLVDDLARARLASSDLEIVTDPSASLHDRWIDALRTADARITGPRDALDRLREEVGRWQERLRRASTSPFRLALRLEEPEDPTDDDRGEVWRLRILLQLREDPSVLVDAADAWNPRGATRELLARTGFHVGEHLLAPLGEVAQLHEPLADALRAGEPDGCELSTAQAHDFLARVAPLLEPLGVTAFIPAWWRGRDGRFQLGVRAQVRTELTGGRRMLDALNLDTLVEYDWRLALGDETLSRDELTKLAAQKSGLVRIRGRWVEIDAGELRAAIAHLTRLEADPTIPSRGTARSASLGALLGAAGAGVVDHAGADITELLTRAAREQPPEAVEPPVGLAGELRDYQRRGYAWLTTMAQLGLGACLADDMGLGKTIQALAAIQHAWETTEAADRRPTLLVCPTSVVTNWQRECERFTPDLPVLVHHGANRARGESLASAVAGRGLVITSYALLARDAAALQAIHWHAAVLDEAQNIKNPGTQHAVAARSLVAGSRVALTGTPVENHVGDLWSIMEFLNPGLLGSQADFRRRYMLPIQAGTFPEARERLRRLTSPFLLRRTKTDPDVAPDLPDRLESVAFCSMTTEQVSLYEAIVRDAASVLRMGRDDARRSGIERRGRILATISRLKQACNHPAQLLGDNSAVAGRSGKLARLEELTEAILEQGERALVFTQFVTMGRMLQRHLHETFGREVLFLHGGTTRAERDRIVEAFQSPDQAAPPLLVLSLKAGGSGLNLTAATHVIHFDRWWNPAVEQQATDRAHRIGQRHDVQVHALVCAGTIEERVDRMLRQKREVSEAIVGSGEQWIGDLADDELLELLQLRHDTLLQPGRLDDIDAKEWRRASL